MARRWAVYALMHVNLLLTVFGGAALATAARLKWDPSTYVALRELLPAEYRAAAAALSALGAALLLLPHLAALAQHVRSPRLLRLYAALLVAVCAAEAAFCAWVARRVLAWLDSPAAQPFLDGIKLTQEIRPLLDILSHWHPLPKRIDDILEEARADGPRNLYVCVAAGALLALLQVCGVLLAVLGARPRPPQPPSSSVGRPRRQRLTTLVRIYYNVDAPLVRYEKLRTAYKDGRIVVL